MLQVNVARLHEDNREALSLAWVAGREGGTAVRREAVAAASLIGHLNLTHPNSIQVIGAYEAATIAGFVERLFAYRPAAVIVADGVAPPQALLDPFVGRYALAPDAFAEIRLHGNALEIESTGRDSMYLPSGKPVALTPVSAQEFELGTPLADHLRFDRDTRGRVDGFTINPGPWPVRARRVSRE